MHQQLGRVRRNITAGDVMHVLQARDSMNCILQRHLAGQHVRQAPGMRHAQHLMQSALSHINVDDKNLLARLSDDSRQVRRNEGLADAGSWARDGQNVVLGLEHCKVQACAEAT